jgi:hypothetical protein
MKYAVLQAHEPKPEAVVDRLLLRRDQQLSHTGSARCHAWPTGMNFRISGVTGKHQCRHCVEHHDLTG